MAKPAALRILPALALCLMGCTALSGSAQAGLFDFGGGKKADAAKTDTKAQPGTDLDSLVRQAQLQRSAGQYDAAIKTLSQLMLVAADDGRVVSEYGKTLTMMGRAQEALGFLTRAEQLQPNDWSIYNALGVAYDQLDKQNEARAAYDHALQMGGEQQVVLTNYALSRMLAHDPDGARALIARVQPNGGDPKIARDIAMIEKLAPAGAAPAARAEAAPPVAAPRMAVASQPYAAPMAAPRAMMPPAQQPVMAPPRPASGVVMQRVPVDPQAGPVAATRAPRALSRPQAVAENRREEASKELEAKADAIAKTLKDKPAAIAQAKADAAKPTSKPAAKMEAAKAEPAKTDPAKPARSDMPKAVARVDMAPPKPAAKADAKPVQTAAKAKDAIPALRMSANAY